MKRCLLYVAICSMSATVNASTLQFNLDKEYTFGTRPAGAPAWMRATIDDGGGSGSVSLKIESLTLTANEFVSKFLLNLSPGISVSSLVASPPTKTGSFADPTVSFGTNSFSAGGGSTFDVLVQFDNSPPENRFGAGDSVVMTISGSPLLNASSFNYLSTGGGSGPLSISAHVQGIGTNANFSGWITNTAPTPEPASLGVLGSAAMLLMRRRR